MKVYLEKCFSSFIGKHLNTLNITAAMNRDLIFLWFPPFLISTSFIYLFIWLCWGVVVACSIFCCKHVDSLAVACGLSSCKGFPGGWEVKASACNTGDLGSIPGSVRSPGEGNGNPLQYSYLENPVDGGAWWATVHRVTKSRTRLSDFTFSFTFMRQKQSYRYRK